MNDKFDELAKGLAQSVTRRQALRRCGVGFAGLVLAAVGLANKAHADPRQSKPFRCRCRKLPYYGCETQPDAQACLNNCALICT